MGSIASPGIQPLPEVMQSASPRSCPLLLAERGRSPLDDGQAPSPGSLFSQPAL